MTFASPATIYHLIKHNILPYDMVNDHNKSILHYAAEYGYEEVIKLLFEKGSYANSRDDKEMTPLHYAIKNGKSRTTATLFIQTDADLRFTSKKGKTAFDYLRKSKLDNPEVRAGKEGIRTLLSPWMEKNNQKQHKIYRDKYQKLT
jgi:ankyrin repeat protein